MDALVELCTAASAPSSDAAQAIANRLGDFTGSYQTRSAAAALIAVLYTRVPDAVQPWLWKCVRHCERLSLRDALLTGLGWSMHA